MTPSTALPALVLGPDAISTLPLAPVGDDGTDGAVHRVLWRGGTSLAGVLTVRGGHHLGEHAHRVNHHHIWVLEGEASILGVKVGRGAYVHVPSGVVHDIDATDTAGCTVFYVYEGRSAD